MNIYGYLLIASAAASIISSFFFWKFHRQQLRHIVRKHGYDEETTFFSTGGRNRILIFSLGADALTVRLITNVIIPKFSLVDKVFTVPYDQIERVDVGQATTTFKLKNLISVESILFGYASGPIARPSENGLRILSTSVATRKAFTEQLTSRGVMVRNVSTSGGRAFKIAVATAIIFALLWGVGLWFYTLGWFT